MGFSREKTREEIQAGMVRQVANLRRSANAFDEGHLEEAERLATSAYAICHDGGKNSVSLLTQLGLKRHIRLPDTASTSITKEPCWVTVTPPLLALRWVGDEIHWGAPCEHAEIMEKKQFAAWWDQIIFKSHRGAVLSRKQLIYALRSQDGGSHFDAKHKLEGYYWFQKEGGHTATANGGTLTINGVDVANVRTGHWHSMRQIAYELDYALIQLGF